ncbi:hypothetical protein DRN97_02870 [Methanosarcinales archaeon]|nr:MAG: hypothetical protein DRN97_02870 [Methanosarcinales archaeon]
MATNDIFYGKTKIFVIKSLEVLEEIKGREGIPKISIEEGSDGGIGTTSRFIQKPDFSYFIFKNWEKIKELPEYGECKKYMYENKTINKHLDKLVRTVKSAARIDVDSCLQRLILRIILESGNLRFNEKIFEEYFEKLRDFFTNDKLQFCAFAPLEGFTTDVDEIRLDTNLRIFKIPTHKLEDLLKNSTYMPIPHFEMLLLRFGIERIYETDKIIGERIKNPSDTPSQETGRIFDEVISALRLFKPGTVGYNFIRTEALDWNPIGGGSIHSGIFTYPYFGEYHLEKNEVPDFKKFFKEFNKNKPTFLDIPLRYFNYAHIRERPEDKLIDYMIAFESLFIKGEVELSYRLSLRVAAFLGENRDEKGRVFNLMREAYNLRSKIVHGSSYSKNIEINEAKLSFRELVSRVEELLRRSIKKSIETGQRPNQILENSPESIFV